MPDNDWGADPNEKGTCGLAGSIDVGLVVDIQHSHRHGLVDNLVDHPVTANPGRMEPFQIATQGFANSMRVLTKRTDEKVEHGNGDFGRNPGNGSPGRAGQDQVPVRRPHLVWARN